MVGTHERQIVRIECLRFRRIHIEDRQRDASPRDRFDEARYLSRRIETD